MCQAVAGAWGHGQPTTLYLLTSSRGMHGRCVTLLKTYFIDNTQNRKNNEDAIKMLYLKETDKERCNAGGLVE